MARSLPRITALTLCAAAIGHLTIALGFAADAETAGIAIAIVDFTYVDTSGEVLDRRAEHEVRLSVFMSALKDDLAAGGKFRVIVPACRPDPCSRSRGFLPWRFSDASRQHKSHVVSCGRHPKTFTIGDIMPCPGSRASRPQMHRCRSGQRCQNKEH